MPKVYVRTQPKTGLKIRHRCAMGFTDVWKEIDIDDATRAALEEDPYLEVSETPTVVVEVAANVQTAATQTATTAVDLNPNNPVKSEAGEGQGDAEQENVGANDNSPAQATADANAAGDNVGQSNNVEKTEIEQRVETIKTAIAKLDPNNAEHWLKDGRPSTIALRDVVGVVISSAERDSVWDEIQAERSVG